MSRIASKACRREPTQKGYHTGAGAAGRESAAPRGIVSYPKRRVDPLAGYGVHSAKDQIPSRESWLAGKVVNSVPKNANEQHKRTKRPARMATMAAAIVDAEGFEELAIPYLYITSLENGTSCVTEVDAKKNGA